MGKKSEAAQAHVEKIWGDDSKRHERIGSTIDFEAGAKWALEQCRSIVSRCSPVKPDDETFNALVEIHMQISDLDEDSQ